MATGDKGNPDKHRNVELKARLGGEEGYERRVAIAKQLTGADGTVITQRDVFFHATTGRLKLRYLEVSTSETSRAKQTDRQNLLPT